MKVILLDKIARLGELGQEVEVANGYARNYLIPKSMAVLANAANREYFQSKRAELEKKVSDRLAIYQDLAKEVDGKSYTIAAKVAEEGKLYGSVGPAEVVDAIAADGGKITKQQVLMPTGHLREIGDYEVIISFNHGDVTAKINVAVVAEE